MEELLLAGKYALTRRLGRGGMAEVFLARQHGVGGFEKLVVVKKPLQRFARDPHFRAMFLEEARMAADLRHPNIVSVVEVDEDERGAPYLVMEYLHGRDVGRVARRCARRGTAIPLAHALQMIIDAASALDYAHKKVDFDGQPLALVHRDISPQNLIATFHGRTVLVDFGIAKARGRSVITEAGMLKGKCAYMSPEQVKGEGLDHRSDLFALGIVLFELCTMKPLFRRRSDLQSLQAVLACEVPAPSSVSPDLDPRLDHIIQTALAPDPDERYDDCGRLAEALEDYLDQRRILHSDRRLARFLERLFFDEVHADEPEAPVLDAGGHTREFDLPRTEEDPVDGGRETQPAAPPADHAANTNLRPPVAPLVGRDDELRALRRAFREGARVVTLAGASGTGTSTLAAVFGYERVGDFSRHGGVWRVDCAQASSIDELIGAVARTFGLTVPPGDGVEARARRSGEMLRHRGRTLLILDGLDGVPAVDLVIGPWLDHGPELSFLIAAHDSLDVPGEVRIQLQALPVPSVDDDDERVASAPSVQLLEAWLARLGRAPPDRATLAEIARRLDGVPLALELAAAQIAREGVDALMLELREEGTGALEGLDLALERSWSILSAPEREALGQLSVLPGGADVETALAVVDVDGHDSATLLDALTRKSLVRRVVQDALGGRLRLSITAPMRALASEHLAPEAHLAAAKRRAAAILPRAVEAARGLDGPGGRALLTQLARERDNLVAIAELALEGGDGGQALAAAIALEPVLRGEPELHLSLLDRALAAAEREQKDRARLALGYEVRADLHRGAERFDAAQADLDQALHLARDTDPRLEGIVYRNQAVLKRARGRASEALHDAKAALGIFRRLGDRHMEARARLELGSVHLEQGDAEAARAAFHDALETFRLVGDRRFEARALTHLAEARAALGEQPVARVLIESAVAILDEMGERLHLGRALSLLGEVNVALGADEAARLAWTRAARELGAAGAASERAAALEHLEGLEASP